MEAEGTPLKYDPTLDNRAKLKIMTQMSQDELLEIVKNPMLPYFDQKLALAINKGDWKTLQSIVDQIDGKKHAGGRPLNEIKKNNARFEKHYKLSKFVYQDTAQTNNPIDTDVLNDLKFAFCIGSTTAEACSYAGITEQGYNKWIAKMPEDLRIDWKFLVEKWRSETILKARNTINNDLEEPSTAKWYLERKRRDEFATRTEQEVKKVEKFSEVSDEDLDGMIGEVTTNEQQS